MGANLRQDLDRQDHYFGGRSLRHHRERQSQNPGQRRDSSGSTTFDLCRKTIGRWPNLVRLQYSKRVDSSLGPKVEGRNANLRQDLDRKNHYFGGRSLRYHRKRQGQNPRQGRNPSGSTTFDFRWKTIGRWPNLERLQYPKGIDSAFGPEVEGRNANLRQDLNRQDHYFGGRSLRYHRERQGQNPGQGRNSSRSTTFDLRRKTIGRWPNLERLQYPKRVHSAFGPEVEGRNANLRQDLDWKNHHFGGRSL